MASNGWALALHGGQREIPPGEMEASRAGCRAALAAGEAILGRGGGALEAVEAVLRLMEDNPVFNAGTGSARNSDGEVEMDAAVMDGATLDLGGVAGIRGVRHPVSVARLLLRETPVLLVAEGARRFAADRGAELCDPRDLIAERPGGGCDTIGCVARDRAGNLAAATSTGGLEGCMPGRVGDSPMPGCGLYADNAAGAVAFSGFGEEIARAMLAARVIQALEAGATPDAAAGGAIARIAALGSEAGGIVLDRHGRIGWAHNGANFAVGLLAEGGAPRVWLSKDEERKDAGHA
ncbi:isoaspartyl peptidase/L-asparaginase family protein [Falsiroseomonas sp. CW058]|uniref:isoaspartyl peptidase/L-asparaginase family protein n=1 Tax=Falsiroseomonas sp. CW058 TaxID=3388664 RepID=UPI003D3116E1